MDDPFSRPGPERSFPCLRSAVCIIVTNASRPEPPRLGFDQFLSVATWTLPASACPCIGSLARSGGISIVMTAPMVDYKIHWLKMMSVPESRAVVGRHDGINGRDSRHTSRITYVPRCCPTSRAKSKLTAVLAGWVPIKESSGSFGKRAARGLRLIILHDFSCQL